MGPTLPRRRQFFKHDIPGIRLVGGFGPYEGRLEVHHDSYWGTVCDDYWGHTDASVVCSQLGFTGGIALNDLRFGEGSGYIWMDKVGCRWENLSL